MRPSSAPSHPPLTAHAVRTFARTQKFGEAPQTHRDGRLGGEMRTSWESAERSNASSQQRQMLSPNHQQRNVNESRQSTSWQEHQPTDAEDTHHTTYDAQSPPAHPNISARMSPEELDEEDQVRGQDEEDDEEEQEQQEEHLEEEQADTVASPENAATPEDDVDEDEAPAIGRKKSDRVKVAVRCRPLLASEQHGLGRIGPRSCVHIQGNEVLLAKSRLFTFDHAFGPDQTQEEVYRVCGAGMVQAAFQGYNSTIFAYGQTGSGKTFSMGSANNTGIPDHHLGIIPRVVKDIYARAARAAARGVEVTTRVSYLEIYQEELKDLLHPTAAPALGNTRNAANSVPAITIREEPSGGVILVGVREEPVRDFADMMRCLTRGSLGRTTGSTLMNEHSSRSHSIFTITMEQSRPIDSGAATNTMTRGGGGGGGKSSGLKLEVTKSKFHLVDLAGSERAKKTGAVGVRFKESVNINRGLLALGNVISALSTSSASGSRHVPYRESKLTRLLADSLGGNSRTLMLACISGSDASFEETHTTLKYAARARNIKNQAVVNAKIEEVPLVVPPPPHSDLIADLKSPANVQRALLAVQAAREKDVETMQREIERLQEELVQAQSERKSTVESERRSERTRAADDQEDEEDQPDEEAEVIDDGTSHRSAASTARTSSTLRALRRRYSSLSRSYSSLLSLFSSLSSEHSWLLSGLIFFIRNLSELYALEKKRDEVKEMVIGLRKEYDTLSAQSDPSNQDRLSSLASEIKAAQKAYVTYRDSLLRLREDLEGFLQIYTQEKMEELQQRKWTEETPQDVQLAGEDQEGMEEEETSPATSAEAARLSSELESTRARLSSVEESLSSLTAAHALAQEDLRYDDEIFEEKVRVIRELTQREKAMSERLNELSQRDAAAQEQVAQLKEANKKLADMMRQMGEEIVKKLSGGGATAPNTARTGLPSARGGQPQQESAGALSARMLHQIHSVLAPSNSPLKSARSPATGASVMGGLGSPRLTDGGGSSSSTGGGAATSGGGAPEFFRAATSSLAREQEDQDEMRLAAEEMESTVGGGSGGPGAFATPARSQQGSRPGTGRQSSRAPPHSSSHSLESRLDALRTEYSHVSDRVASLHQQHNDLMTSLSGLAAHITSRKNSHAKQSKALEKQLRDVRIQIQMKQQALDEATAAAQASQPLASIEQDMASRLRDAEQHYQSLEQELSLKQRLLGALSPRPSQSQSSSSNTNKNGANVRAGIEADVRQLERELQQAGRALEELQLGSSGPQRPVAASSSSKANDAALLAQQTQLQHELSSLHSTESSLQSSLLSSEESYTPAHAGDKRRYAEMQEEARDIVEEVRQAEEELEEIRQQMEKVENGQADEQDDQQQEHMQIEVTTASGSKIRPPTAGNTNVSRVSATPQSSRSAQNNSSVLVSPASAAQSHKRKAQWLAHQVAAFLTEERTLKEIAEAQQAERRLEEERRRITEQKSELLERSMRVSIGHGASGNAMAKAIKATASAAAGASRPGTSSQLNQTLRQVDQQLHQLDARSSELVRQSRSVSSQSQASRRGDPVLQGQLAAMRNDLQQLQQQRSEMERKRQNILAQLSQAQVRESTADSQIVDGALLDAVLSREDRAQLAQFDEALDDMQAALEYRQERIAELTQQASGAMSHRGARPGTAAAAVSANTSLTAEPPVDLHAHRASFLSKATAIFDPTDSTEAAFLAEQVVQVTLEKNQTEQLAMESRLQLESLVAEKDTALAAMEAQVRRVLEDAEEASRRQEREWKQRMEAAVAQARMEALAQAQQQPQNISPPQSSTSLSTQQDSRSPVLKLKMLKSHMHARSSQNIAAGGGHNGSANHHGLDHSGVNDSHHHNTSASASSSHRAFGPSRTFTPANLPLSVHTPLLYNQSPSVTPRSSYQSSVGSTSGAGAAGANELSPSRSRGQSQREEYVPQLSPNAHRLRAQQQKQQQKQQHDDSFTAAPANKQKMQLSLLKRKQSLRSSQGVSTSNLHAAQQQQQMMHQLQNTSAHSAHSEEHDHDEEHLEDHEEHEHDVDEEEEDEDDPTPQHDDDPDGALHDVDPGDFSRSNNFLSARAPSAQSANAAATLARHPVPQLRLSQANSGREPQRRDGATVAAGKVIPQRYESTPSSSYRQ